MTLLLGKYLSDIDDDKSDKAELESPKKLSSTTWKNVAKVKKILKQSSIFAHDKFKVMQYQKIMNWKVIGFYKGNAFVIKEEGTSMAGQ